MEENNDIEEEKTKHTTIADELSQLDFIDENAATDCSGSDINSDQEFITCSNDFLEVPVSYTAKQGITHPIYLKLYIQNYNTLF